MTLIDERIRRNINQECLCERRYVMRLITYLNVFRPRRGIFRICRGLPGTVGSLSLGRGCQIIGALASCPLPILHLDEGRERWSWCGDRRHQIEEGEWFIRSKTIVDSTRYGYSARIGGIEGFRMCGLIDLVSSLRVVELKSKWR